MIDIQKHLDFFNPVEVKAPIHIIGCGAIGSHVAEMLVRLGIDKLNLYDFDKVEAKNVANQMFSAYDRSELKTEALARTLAGIDPQFIPQLFSKGWASNNALAGHVFLCVDNIDLRRQIVDENFYNPRIKAMYDFRMRLSDAQHYAAAWDDDKAKKALLGQMQFTHEEAQAATPVSACGTTLSVLPTVRMITALGVSNFINYIKGEPLKKMILVDAFDFEVEAI
jgi:sulfur carrier protein ThiS adenylyltransferase